MISQCGRGDRLFFVYACAGFCIFVLYMCKTCVSQSKDLVMREFLHLNNSINDSSVAVWDGRRIKLFTHFTHKQVVFIPFEASSSSSSFPCHSGSLSACTTALLLKKEPITSDIKITSPCCSAVFGFEQTICTRQQCQFPNQSQSLLLFLVILSQWHKRQSLNPASLQFNTKLTVWQAIM